MPVDAGGLAGWREYVQHERFLKGLGGVVGNKVETFLDQGIQGYREREDQAF